MHGGFGREQTLNNMAAMGPDFKAGFVDNSPMGNIDIAPTLARILGLEMPSAGSLKGRVLEEAIAGSKSSGAGTPKTMLSAPDSDGVSTLLEYQEFEGLRYYDSACLVQKGAAKHCQ